LSLEEEQQRRLEELRDLEQRAPELLAALPAQVEAVNARLPRARETADVLAREAGSSSGTVKGNTTEAEKRLAFARTRIDAGNQALAAADRSGAARAARDAQQAAVEAGALLDAIDHLAEALAEARSRFPHELAAARTDVESARRAGADMPEDLRTELRAAEEALAAAEREAGNATPDILVAMRSAMDANARADKVLAAVKEARDRREREAQMAGTAVESAQSAYRRAADYVFSRRGGVEREARTRLAEAERHLQRATGALRDDPRAAIDAAQQAERLATDALAIAQEDFSRYDRRGGRRGADFGLGGLGGVILGEVLLGGGGFGGSRWGSPKRRGGGFGRSMGGMFGGGRSMGGMFGGGRSRGGRW
jgi:hypothetical protein